MLPITLGRVPPSDIVLKDSEVSGKHARINWNAKVGIQELFMHLLYLQLNAF
jgi:protein phosphatase